MNVLVTYVSSSGNTRRVAEAVFEGVQGAKVLKPMSEVEDVSGYDIVFVGFPVIAKGAPRRTRKFLATQAKGKKVALFVTHGMPDTMDMLRPMLKNCEEAARCSEVLGTLDCQGRLAGWMASLFRVYPNAAVREWVRAGGESVGVGHPSEEDLARARDFARRVTAGRDQANVA